MSADPRLWRLRLGAERDRALSDGAFRLLSALTSWLYVSPYGFDEQFPLTWTTVQQWCGIGKDQAYRRLKELLDRSILRKEGLRGCPPAQWFSLGPNCSIYAAIDSRTNAAIDSGRNAAINSRQKAPSHISNPFRKEVGEEKGRKSDRKNGPPVGASGAPEGPENRPGPGGPDKEEFKKPTVEELLGALKASVEPIGGNHETGARRRRQGR